MGDTGRICTISQVAGLLHLLQWAIERQVYWLIYLSLVLLHACQCCTPNRKKVLDCHCLQIRVGHLFFATALSCWWVLCIFYTNSSLTSRDWVCLTGKSLSGRDDPPECTLKFRVTPYSPVPSAGEGKKCNLEGLSNPWPHLAYKTTLQNLWFFFVYGFHLFSLSVLSLQTDPFLSPWPMTCQ